jgi:Fe-S-cluster containining protein
MAKKSSPKTKITSENKCGMCRSSICCTYITQEIDAPRSIYDFDVWLWMLYHQDVQFYKEDGVWHLKILNHCLNLQPDGRCGIYETRPIICREHENDFCEFDQTTEESADIHFGSPADLEKYCAKRFKNWKSRYTEYSKKKPDARHAK